MEQVAPRWALVLAAGSGFVELVLVMAEEGHTSMPYPRSGPAVQTFRTPRKWAAVVAGDTSKEEGIELSGWYCTHRLQR